MLTEIRSRLAGKRVLILGVGNRLRGDDAVGSMLVERLQGKVRVPLIDAGDVPENYLGPIERSRAEVVLVIDATDLGAKPGDTAVLEIEQVRAATVSTHTASLELLFKAIPVENRPQVIVLGIQPENTTFGQELSEQVRNTMESLAAILIDYLEGEEPGN